MKDKAIAVGGKHKRNVKRHRVVERVLHSIADAVIVVLCLNDGDGNIRLVIKDVIGALCFATCNKLSTDDDASLVKATSSRICIIPSQPARFTAELMNLEQISRSLRSFLFIRYVCSLPRNTPLRPDAGERFATSLNEAQRG
jgi:hypothetical protein